MPKGSQLTFNGGEFTEFMDPRVDVAKYGKGCRRMENQTPTPYGATLCAVGTEHGGKAKHSGKRAILWPFSFSNTTTFFIEVGEFYFRFFKGTEAVMAGEVPYEVSTPYRESELLEIQIEQQNDVVYIVHPNHRHRRLSREADDNWTLEEIDYSGPFDYPALAPQNVDEDFKVTPNNGITTKGATVRLRSNKDLWEPSDVGDLFMLGHYRGQTQFKTGVTGGLTTNPFYILGDFVYQTLGIANYNVVFEVSEDEVNWRTFQTYRIDGTANNVENTGSFSRPTYMRVRVSNFSGADADSPPQITIQVADPVRTGLVRINSDGYSGPREVWGTVIEPLGKVEASSIWAEEFFSDKRGQPRALCFHNDRLCFASNDVWISQPGNYENFRTRNDADSGFRVPIRRSGSPLVQWMESLRELRVGTNQAEAVIVPENTTEVFSYSNYRVRWDGTYGSKHLRAEAVNGSVIFAQAEGRTIRFQLISGIEEYYDSNTLTTLADHILGDGVEQTAYQRQRYPTWHGVRGDGQIASLLFEQAQNVQAWYRRVTEGEYESIAVVPQRDTEDLVAYIVKREVNGVTERHIEFKVLGQFKAMQDEDRANLWFVDDGKKFTGDGLTEVSVPHLAGKTVAILGDGAAMGEKVVSANGVVSLDWPCSTVIVGLPYDYYLSPVYLESPDTMGRSKQISKVIPHLWRSGPVEARILSDDQEGPWNRLRTGVDTFDDKAPLFTGTASPIESGGDWGYKTTVEFKGRSPLPMNMQAITLEFEA